MPAKDAGSVSAFSAPTGLSEERLCSLLAEAGRPAGPDTVLDRDSRIRLLLHLRARRGNDNVEIEPGRIALKRRRHREIRISAGGPRGPRSLPPRQRTVIVEERRTRNYIRRGSVQEQELAAAATPPEPEAKVQLQEEPAQAATPPLAPATPASAEAAAGPPPGSEAQAETSTPPGQDEGRAPDDAARPKPEKLHVSPEMAARRRKKRRIKSIATRTEKQHTFQKPVAPMVRDVEVPEAISVSELAQRMSVKANDVIRLLMSYGTMVTINQSLDQETARVVVDDLGHRAILVKSSSLEEEIGRARQAADAAAANLAPRPPVVTVMGHVDHGKTSLLDRIRASSLAAAEQGGITQHIGAYTVDTPHGMITFLDTPGHEAFTAMRVRGAQVTDLVVLVVAADDGVMPQTREAVRHAQAAAVPILVAINKIDRPDAQPDRIRHELAGAGLNPEEWGGENIFVNVSAQTGEGIDQLLEALRLQAEILELQAPAEGAATGTVIEARIDRARGAVATVLVQGGLLRKGDMLLSGATYGRVRQLLDQDGRPMQAAGPSTPVEVIGLTGAPMVGDPISCIPDERMARELAGKGKLQAREEVLRQRSTLRLPADDVFAQIEASSGQLHVIVKTDVQGTEQALVNALQGFARGDAEVSLVHHGIGGITESDVHLAKTCQGLILGFNVRADSAARKLAEEEGITISYYSVIYELLEDVTSILEGMATPEEREQNLGIAEVRETFRSPRLGNIAGCMVTGGLVRRNARIRVLRDDVVIYEGELESLRRFKEDVVEVKAGTECGIGVKNYDDVRVGDRIEVYERITQQPGAR